MPGRMKNPTISDPDEGFISILIDDTYPANKKGVIVKNSNKEKYFMKATGYDELKGYLYFTVYEAGVLDTDGEFMKSEDLDYMHLDLMKNMKTTKLADINHDTKRLDNVFLMEIYKEVDKEGNTTALKGAYYIKENELLMQKAKEDKINGVSIMGRVEDMVEEPLSKWDKLLNFLSIKHKDEIENKNKEEVDMTLEELNEKTDEELKEMGFQRYPETPPEEPKAEPAEPETPPEEPEQLKSELETLKADLTEKELLLSKAEEKIEKLEADNKELKKMKLINRNEDGGKPKIKNETPPENFAELMNKIGEENE